jgi:hypothetical protein
LEGVTGLASGYCGKLLAGRPARRMGVMSRGLLLQALGLRAVEDRGRVTVFVDEEAFARMRPRLVRRSRHGRRRGVAVLARDPA